METNAYPRHPRAEVEVRLTQQLGASSRIGGVWSVLQYLRGGRSRQEERTTRRSRVGSDTKERGGPEGRGGKKTEKKRK